MQAQTELPLPTMDQAGTIADPGGFQGVADQAMELIQAGGVVVVILLAMSVVALTIILMKIWQFQRARIGRLRPVREALALYRSGRPEEALLAVQQSRNPAGRVLATAIRGRMRRNLPEAQVREEVLRFGGDLLEELRFYFRPLEVIATLAPLLGLFGTVLGMIDAFRQLQEAGNQVDPSVLSGGIWVALLTTAVGLAVAMPVVALLNWLERRVERLAHEMDSIVTQVFTEDLSYLPQEELRHGAGGARVPFAASGG